MTDSFIGEIRLFPMTFVPLDWLLCDGQQVAVQQYQALAAVIGTIYGGNANPYFNLPNLNGRVAVGTGNNPADPFDPTIGKFGGATSVALSGTMMPAHNHVLNGEQVTVPSRSATPQGNQLTGVAFRPTSGAPTGAYPYAVAPAGSTPVPLSPATLSPAGNSAAHENRQPALALQWCICVSNGVFPVRP